MSETQEAVISSLSVAHKRAEVEARERETAMNPWGNSNWRQLRRNTAILLKFLSFYSKKQKKEVQESIEVAIPSVAKMTEKQWLTPVDLREAERTLLRKHQAVFLVEDRRATLPNLQLFKDPLGLWRCHGRLDRAPLPEETKNPILVLPHSQTARLLIKAIHETLLHASENQTLAGLRSRFWVPTGRREVRRLLQACVPCRKKTALSYPLLPTIGVPCIVCCGRILINGALFCLQAPAKIIHFYRRARHHFD